MNKIIIFSFTASLALHYLVLTFVNKNKSTPSIYKFLPSDIAISIIFKEQHKKNNKSKPSPSLSNLNQSDKAFVENARSVGEITPKYPYHSKVLQEEGEVYLNVFVDKFGQAKRAEITKSSGHRRLDDEAIKSVLKSQFIPSTYNGKNRDSLLKLKFNFSLK